MVNVILLILAAAIVLILVIAATRPNTFRVSRSISVNAPADAIYPQVVDFQRWAIWSPFEALDPDMKKTFSGPEGGVGAVYAWDGNKKAGAGRMEIVEASPPKNVSLKLEFTRPFKSENMTDFTMEPQGDSTRVTWTMRGDHTFMSKVMCVFISMDSMVGKDFEQGLANLKRAAESRPTAPVPEPEVPR